MFLSFCFCFCFFLFSICPICHGWLLIFIPGHQMSFRAVSNRELGKIVKNQ
nr:MAG TPA: hypothetical protein [Caudoviricetes sp.]